MKRILSVLTLALVAVLPAQAQFGSDDFSTGISPAKWTAVQQNHGTMTVVGANGHASFLVTGSSSAEQNAYLIGAGRVNAATDWTTEIRGHDVASFSTNGSSQLQFVVVDIRALSGGPAYTFTAEFARGSYPGLNQSEFQSGSFATGDAGGTSRVDLVTSLAVTDFRLRIIYRATAQRFESWYDDTGLGTNWKQIHTAPLTQVVPDGTPATVFGAAIIANCYYGPVTEGQLWADDFRLVNSLLDVPVITTQPAAQSVTAGSSVSFSVTATGATSYQWRKGGVNLSGATGSTYSITGAQASHADSYTVVVSNANGGVTSYPATLTLPPASPVAYSLWTVGGNWLGQLGDGSTVNKSTPVQVATGVPSLAAGQGHSHFVKTDGTLWSMGNNSSGELGDGTTANRATPVQVASGVGSVAAGWDHSLFVKTNGTLWAMGYNSSGGLGDGTITQRATPVQVASGVAAVAGGFGHSLFVKTDGTLWGMGRNDYGQLGDGTTTQRATPVQVASGVRAVAAGGLHSFFIKNDGSLWTMGWSVDGQLGIGLFSTAPPYGITTPAKVADGVMAVAAGYVHSLFVKTDGTLWTMGHNGLGQLGYVINTVSRAEPVLVAGGVSAVAAGFDHSLFLKNDHTLWAMGQNDYGQLGDGTTSNRATPVQVASGVNAVAGGGSHTLIVKESAISLPVITTQPPANLTFTAGATVNFTVLATGSGLTYQWRKDGVAIGNATSATLTLNSVTRAASGVYSVVVTSGGSSTTSGNATLRVIVPQQLSSRRGGSGQFQLLFTDPDTTVGSDLARFEVHHTANFLGASTVWVTNSGSFTLSSGKILFDDTGSVGTARRFYRVIEK